MEELPNEKAARTSSKVSNNSLFSSNTNTNNASIVYDSNTADNSLNLPILDWKSIIILLLVVIVVFSYYGIHILNLLGDAIQTWVAKISPIFNHFFDLLGDSTGSAINKTAEITSDVAKTGIDIAEGSIQNIGNIMIGEKAIGKAHSKKHSEPEPDVPEDTIQKSLSSAKTKWCLVGEYQNKRGCIDISESDKCLSGQVFPNERMCLNPNLAPTLP
jgi:hypothetical protein